MPPQLQHYDVEKVFPNDENTDQN